MRWATKVVPAEMTPASMMPTSGTATTGAFGGSDRMMRRKSPVPSSAVTMAMAILAGRGAPGQNIATTRIPTLADSVVPTVVGSTKRLRTSNCISRPARASDAPASKTATVRGIRDANRLRRWASVAVPVRKSMGERSATPTNRLTLDNATSPSNAPIRPQLRGRSEGCAAWAVSSVSAVMRRIRVLRRSR